METVQEQNLIIIVALFAIVIAYLAGYVHGFRKGKADEQQELTRKHNRIASRQLHDLNFGQLHGRN
jgi:hypothetical protein